MIISLSWDDGTGKDAAIVDILRELGLPATFYLIGKFAKKNWKKLYEGFEVGNHTLNHFNLKKIDSKKIIYEVVECQKILEDIFGKKIQGFCYPGGGFNDNIENIIQDLNFNYYRTIENAKTKFSSSSLIPNFCLDDINNFDKNLGKCKKYCVCYGHAQNFDNNKINWIYLKLKEIKDKGFKFVSHMNFYNLKNKI